MIKCYNYRRKLWEVTALIKKISIILTFVMLICTFTACTCFSGKNDKKDNEDKSTTEITETTEATEKETEKSDKENIPASGKENDGKISFSDSEAKKIGSFESAKYGKLVIYLQQGHFLILNDFGDHLFTVFAENISVTSADDKKTVIGADMNFDGNTDFGVRYYKDELNSYYYCFLWDSEEEGFTYFHPLTGLANPIFEEEDETVREMKRITYSKYTENIYSIGKNSITLIRSNEDMEEETENEVLGGEVVSTDINVMENGNSALLTLKTNKNSKDKWTCFIENESIVSLSSENEDPLLHTQEFLLTSKSGGATTVIFRFIENETKKVIAEKNINVFVSDDMTVKIVIP